MFTSTAPLSYGGFDAGAVGRPDTLFKHFRDNGYRTTAISTLHWVNSYFGYGDGLDTEPAPDRAAFLKVGRNWRPNVGPRANALTCDVEDYFQVSAFEDVSPRSSWLSKECRIERNVDRILRIYADHGAVGTFFTLGWVAQHYPQVVRKIAAAGHEVASHGMEHRRVWDLSADEFRDDVATSKKLLEDLTGEPVTGFRAASWSFDTRTHWAHRTLAEEGYRYSSSIYPVQHDHYGLPNAPRAPYYVKDLEILEVPANATVVFGRNVPSSGGGYFRLFPYGVSKWLSTRYQEANDVPAVFYYHPWEIDPDQPRMSGISFRTRFRHYLNLGRFEQRLTQLLRDFTWDRMDRIYLEQA